MEEKLNRHKELGEFIHFKRNEVSPDNIPYIRNSRRRTPGLRREEVAYLSNIGVSWYTWLEQGKPIKVSRKALGNICNVLNLTRKEIEYVFSLADLAPPSVCSFYDDLNASYKNMLDTLSSSPAFIVDRFFNIVYWNRCFGIIFPDINDLKKKERNLILIAFSNEKYRSYFSDWKKNAREILSQFRLSCSKFIDDPIFYKIIKELRQTSPFFNDCWSENYLSPEKNMVRRVIHPELGELFFEQTSYILDSEEQNYLKMYIDTPVSGTDTSVKVSKALSAAKTEG